MKRAEAVAALLAIGIFLDSCTIGSRIEQQIAFRRDRLKDLSSFAVIYKNVSLEKLRPFQMVVIEADAFSEAEIAALKAQEKIVLAYLNIGEIEQYRWYADQIQPEWLLAQNPHWEDHVYVNPGHPGWQKLLLQKITRKLLKKGVDGFMLDSVDMAAPNQYSQLKPQMAKLIAKIRKRFPHHFLLVNNGDYLLPEIHNIIDGLMVEEVFTKMDAALHVKVREPEAAYRIVDKLSSISNKWQIPIFFVDYIPDEGILPWSKIEQVCRREGLVGYVTDLFASAIHDEFYR